MNDSSKSAAGSQLVRLRAAAIGHGRKALGPSFDFSIDAGDFVLLVGPNGAGKTTLARTLMGVIPPVGGSREAAVGSRPVRFGYVPQREHLDALWPFTALDVALLGAVPSLRPFERFGAGRKARAREILEQVGIGGLGDRPFRDLSGGQQQRALIARALVAEPDVLVLDEPTNHLDVPGERAVFDLLGALHRSYADRAIVVVAHHLEAAMRQATRVVVVRQGQAPIGRPPEQALAEGLLDDLRTDGALS